LLRRLSRERIIPREVDDLFYQVRVTGNRATHHLSGTHDDALTGLKIARQLGIWFHRTFGRALGFKAGKFVPPPDPAAATQALHAELTRLREELATSQTAAERARAEAEEHLRSRLRAEELARKEQEDRAAAEELTAEAEAARAALAGKLAQLQAVATPTPAVVQKLAERATNAARTMVLDELARQAILAERIRRFAFDNYVEPMDGAPDAQIRIRAGAVHSGMKLNSRMPSVCSALDARIFQFDFGLELVKRTGPPRGANVEWVFRVQGTGRAMQEPAEQTTKTENAIDLDKLAPRGNLADRIRRFASDTYVSPVDGAPDAEIRIRAGDVHKAMRLSGRLPAVCGALDSMIFQRESAVELVRRTGPLQGANVEWVFRMRSAKPA